MAQTEQKLKAYIKAHPDYIVKYEWDNHTTYSDYLNGIDMVFGIVYSLRDAYSLKNHNLAYTDLPDQLQKEVRKQYPIRLTQANYEE